MPSRFLPKTFTVLRGYTRRQLAADFQAGLIVGVVAALEKAGDLVPESESAEAARG